MLWWNFKLVTTLLLCLLGGIKAQSQPLDPCASLACLNGGTCALTPLSASAYCRCTPEYTGSRCELPRNVLAARPVPSHPMQVTAAPRLSAPGLQSMISLGTAISTPAPPLAFQATLPHNVPSIAKPIATSLGQGKINLPTRPTMPFAPFPTFPQPTPFAQPKMNPNLLNVFFAASLANNYNFFQKLLHSSQQARSPVASPNTIANNSQPVIPAVSTIFSLNQRRGDTDFPTLPPPVSTQAPITPTTTPVPPTFPTVPPTFPTTRPTVPPTFPTTRPTVPPTFPTYRPPVPPTTRQPPIRTVPPYIPPIVLPPITPPRPIPPVVWKPKPVLNATNPSPGYPSGPCSLLQCPLGSVCRLVVSPLDMTTSAQCVHNFLLKPGVDMDCNNQLYLMALLVPTTPKPGFQPMECKDPNLYATCPVGSACVTNSRTGRFICCAGGPPPQRPGDPTPQRPLTFSPRVGATKAGVCPSGNTFVCGGRPCTTDYDCEGIQKCCQGCGKFCTNPMVVPPADRCGGCPHRHSCVPQTANTCPPGQPCIASLKLPTCVPDQCLGCRPDQFCQKVGSVCDEQRQEQQAEKSPGSNLIQSAVLKAYPQLQQYLPPPPCIDMYQCVQRDQCGGCPMGQKCEMTGIACVAGPCTASFRCVTPYTASFRSHVDPCGGCAEGQQCVSLGTAVCTSVACRTHRCVPTSAMD